MKKLLFVISIILSVQSLSAQGLIDIYKKGAVKLVPDTGYAQNNDWDKVFETYYDTLHGRPMGNRKSLVLLPNGSVVVNHAYRNYYSLFKPKGEFDKEFGIRNSKGQKLKKANAIQGVVNNNTFFTSLDNMGKMNCFDFDGNLTKTLTLDYMARGIISLPNNKLAVVGWVIWKTKFRDFVAIVDYETNEQKIIWEHFTDRCNLNEHCELFNYSYGFEKGGAVSFNTMPYTKHTGISSPPKINYVNNKLIVAIPTTGEIITFDLEGNQMSKEKIEWAKNYISVEEQKEIHSKAIERFENRKGPIFGSSNTSEEEIERARTTMLKQMKDDLAKIKDPIPIPIFSTILKDSDDNLLFFEFPKEEGANKFNVWIYKDNGKFICQSSFVCDDYNLAINPNKMVFHNGYVYGLQTLKEAKGNPLRLVRFKVTNN